ncbi:hypothetical protein [Nonomuraea sp. NPDC005692]|uniref:hypothetical protein n=1 Tax=Nonomuraea sp. NPDC005692 TaxID=3157168 RepID=UPI0033CB6EF9
MLETIETNGGLTGLVPGHEALAAFHGDNYLPLLDRFYRSHRGLLPRLAGVLALEPAGRLTNTDGSRSSLTRAGVRRIVVAFDRIVQTFIPATSLIRPRAMILSGSGWWSISTRTTDPQMTSLIASTRSESATCVSTMKVIPTPCTECRSARHQPICTAQTDKTLARTDRTTSTGLAPGR